MEERSYAPGLRHLRSFSQTASGGLVEERIYDRTPLGLKRKTTMPVHGLVRDYGFDRTGWIELETETNSEGQQELIASYEIDPAFNYERIERIVQSPTSRAEGIRLFTVDNRNRYALVNDEVPEWDSNGNLVSWRGATLRYDGWNRLVEATLADGRQLSFIRDGSGDVVRRSVSGPGGTSTIDRVVWENDVLEEWAEGNLVGRYVYGREIDEIIRAEIEGESLYPLQDELQNVLALTDESGLVLERYRYDGYGYVRAFDADGGKLDESVQPWSRFFQGREALPGLDAYDFRNRVLWPELARFGQEDPLGFADSPNLYQAMLGAPVSYRDPLGTEVEKNEPYPYSAEMGTQAHRIWMDWLRRSRGLYMGLEDVTAFYDKTIGQIIVSVPRRPASKYRRKEPDVVRYFPSNKPGQQRHRSANEIWIWELKPPSYATGKLSAAQSQVRGYQRALRPATLGTSWIMAMPFGELMQEPVVEKSGRAWVMRTYSLSTPTHTGLVFYELYRGKNRLRDQLVVVAEKAFKAVCRPVIVAAFTNLGVRVGASVGEAVGASGGAVATAPGGATVIVGAASGFGTGSVIGGAVGGVGGAMIGETVADAVCGE